MIQIGEKLKELRTEKRMTQKDLAEKLNVTAQAVSRWENNEVEPSLETLGQLSSIFDISMDELFGRATESATATTPPLETPVAPEVRYVVNETRPCLAVCEACNTPLYSGADIVRGETNVATQNGMITVRALCKPCSLRNQARIKREEREELLSCRNQMWVWGGISVGIWLAIGILFAICGIPEALGVCALFAIPTFCMLGCIMLDNNFVEEVFRDIAGWGIRSFPGIIFTFDVDGLLFLIGMRILFGAIACVTSLAAFFLAVVIGLVLGIFVYPYAVIKHFRDRRALVHDIAALEASADEAQTALQAQ